MKLTDLVYLKHKLNEEIAKKSIDADSEMVDDVVKLLKCTDLAEISYNKLIDLCDKLLFAKYGKTFLKLLSCLGNYDKKKYVFLQYRFLIDEYIEKAFDIEEEYIQLFEKFERVSSNDKSLYVQFNYKEINNLLVQELKDVKQETISVSDFLENGGSISELVLRLQEQKTFSFNLQTRIGKTDEDKINISGLLELANKEYDDREGMGIKNQKLVLSKQHAKEFYVKK